jgi:alpha-tubulin suppressor-like RCC1 family protein
VAWSTSTGDVYVCGDNSEGCLGLGDQDPHEEITQVHSFSEAASYGIIIESIAVGDVHSLALARSTENSSSQFLFGWGANSFNQLGDNWSQTEDESESIVLVPHQMLESFEKQITSVFCHSTFSAVVTIEGEVEVIEQGLYMGKRGL